jgi:hypothetical protein
MSISMEASIAVTRPGITGLAKRKPSWAVCSADATSRESPHLEEVLLELTQRWCPLQAWLFVAKITGVAACLDLKHCML